VGHTYFYYLILVKPDKWIQACRYQSFKFYFVPGNDLSCKAFQGYVWHGIYQTTKFLFGQIFKRVAIIVLLIQMSTITKKCLNQFYGTGFRVSGNMYRCISFIVSGIHIRPHTHKEVNGLQSNKSLHHHIIYLTNVNSHKHPYFLPNWNKFSPQIIMSPKKL